MSFNDKLESLNDVFFDTEKWGEEASFISLGDEMTVDVIWDEDSLPGTNEVPGDGVAIERDTGRANRESITIECSAELDVNPRRVPPDRFVRSDGTVAQVKRIIGRDAKVITIRCIRRLDQQVRRDTRRG